MAALTRPLRGARGLTLTEVVVVMVIGTLLMAGIVGFYLSSQGVWLDSSTQVITQREATLVASAIRDSVRKSSRAVAADAPDSLHQQLALYKQGDQVPYYYFWWNAGDSLVYCGTTVGGAGSGPMGVSRALRLQFVAINESATTPPCVRMDMRLLTANGDGVDMSTFAVLRNP